MTFSTFLLQVTWVSAGKVILRKHVLECSWNQVAKDRLIQLDSSAMETGTAHYLVMQQGKKRPTITFLEPYV